MSWTVDGKTYHTWASYQDALEKRTRRLTEARAAQLCREAVEVRERMRSREREAESAAAAGDPERAAQLQQEIALDVKRLRRIRDRLISARRSETARAEAEPAAATLCPEAGDALAAGMAGTHPSNASGATAASTPARQDAQASAASPAAPPTAVSDPATATALAELTATLTEAESHRRALESRLEAALAALAARAEADRQARLRSLASELERASAQAAEAAALLASASNSLDALDLTEEAHAAFSQLEQARALIAQGDGQGALALAATSFAASRNIEMRARRRRAELAASRARVAERLFALRALAARPEVERYFVPELSRAREIAAALERRAEAGYATWRRLELEADQDERRLERLEDEVQRMVCAAPVVKDLAAARTERAKALVEKLAGIYGPVSALEQRFAIEADRKSALIVACDFGGARVDVHMGLDGDYTIDGYGHDTNATCSRRGQQVVDRLVSDTLVTGQHVEQVQNRAGPAPHAARTTAARSSGAPGSAGPRLPPDRSGSAPAPRGPDAPAASDPDTDTEWRTIGDRLAEIERLP